MKDLRQFDSNRIEAQWIYSTYGVRDPKGFGVFVFRRNNRVLRVIASVDKGWDHVSISLEKRTPSWDEMEYIKHLLFDDHEVAMQLHVGVRDHINIHPNVLHLWRPHEKEIPLPPKEMV